MFWTGYINPKTGYAQLGPNTVHRLIYRLVYGEIAKGKDVMHSCNKKPCINPGHLKQGSRSENMVGHPYTHHVRR